MRPCRCDREDCYLCSLWKRDARYQALWGEFTTPCKNLGKASGDTVACATCKGSVRVKLYDCAVFGSCTLGKALDGLACCAGCKRYETMRWSYGVTTVPSRRDTLLPKTLASLKLAGFDKPHLFVDGKGDYSSFGLETTIRSTPTRTAGNWILSLYELYIREPVADRYAVFQDDFVTYRNLRQYLEKCKYTAKEYWNLYTFPQNLLLAKGREGWFESNGRGLGAVALVFNREAVRTLLASQYMVDRPMDATRGWRAVDGGIVEAMKKAGYTEYVHNPSLVQHTGQVSSMGNSQQQLADSFRGESFDASTLVK